MKSKYKLWICIIGNFIVLLFVVIMCELTGQGSKYWQFGPNKDLIVITTKIDTYLKYFILFFVISIVNTVKMFVEEIGMPVLDSMFIILIKNILKNLQKQNCNFMQI